MFDLKNFDSIWNNLQDRFWGFNTKILVLICFCSFRRRKCFCLSIFLDAGNLSRCKGWTYPALLNVESFRVRSKSVHCSTDFHSTRSSLFVFLLLLACFRSLWSCIGNKVFDPCILLRNLQRNYPWPTRQRHKSRARFESKDHQWFIR